MDDGLHTPALVYDSADEYRPEPEPEPAPLAWCDGGVRIGIHTSIAGDISSALESAHKLGCNALQIFSASPRMWPRGGARIGEADAARFRARRAELALGPLAIHANYLINLASPDRVMRTRSIQAFHDELVRANMLGADFLVVHPGAGLGKDPARAVSEAAEALRQAARGIRFGTAAFRDMARGGLRVLIENTSGMGSAIGWRFEELRAILDRVPDLPVGVCIDTAHLYAAGYDIRSEVGLRQTVASLDRIVGLERVALIHVNDLKTAFGSRVDRHAHLGRGTIGLEALRRIVTHPRLSAGGAEGLPGRAFILETPIDVPGDDRRNVRALWALAGVPSKLAPPAKKGFSMVRAARSGPSAGADAANPPGERAGDGTHRAGDRARPSSKRAARRRAPGSRPKPRG
jgi:deoxyribonuclease-4